MYSAVLFLAAGLLATALVTLLAADVVLVVPLALLVSASIVYYCAIRRAGQQTMPLES